MASDTHAAAAPSRSATSALRFVDAGPRPFFLAAVASLAVTCALTVPIAALIRPPSGPLPAPQRDMILAALAGLCLSAVLGYRRS